MDGLGQARKAMTYEELMAARAAAQEKALERQRQAAEAQRQAFLDAELKRQQQVLYLTLLAQGGEGGPVTEVSSPITGDFIEADYKELFRNTTNNPVRVQVFADLTNPGVGVILSLTRDRSDVGKIDALSLTANGRTESVTTILLPTYSLWGRDFDAQFFPMQSNDVLRIRVFDPTKLINYGQLYPVNQQRF